MPNVIQLRRGTAAQWTSANPILAAGEPGLETDTNKVKFGNGTSTWTALAYFAGGGAASPLTTKGDIYTRSASADARLPVGADGKILSASSAATTGLAWVDSAALSDATPAPSSISPTPSTDITAARSGHRHPSDLHACAHPISIGASGGYCGNGYLQAGPVARDTAGQGIAVPVTFDQELPLDRMAVFVEGAGAAGTAFRLALYADHATYRNHHPGLLLRDCGTTPVAGSFTAANNMVQFAFPSAFTPEKGKRYWPVIIWTTTNATNPSVYYMWADFNFPSDEPLLRGSAARILLGITGAPPADLSAYGLGGHNGNPRFWFRAA